MNNNPAVKSIKNSQREAQYFRELSQLFLRMTLDDPRVQGLQINRVQLSADGGICFIFFFCPGGEQEFKEKMPYLKMYKPSLRKALSQAINGRYTPDLVFRFDATFEKQIKLEQLLDKVKSETPDVSDDEPDDRE